MMSKLYLVFTLVLIVAQDTYAQYPNKLKTKYKTDTAVYLFKNPAHLVNTRDSADYAMFILPPDPSDKNALYPVYEYYMNGKRRLTGMTHNQFYILTLEGPCMTFFENGKRKTLENYKGGRPLGELITYYPNGQVYTVEKYNDERAINTKYLLLMECRDSTGQILAENGTGKWLRLDADMKKVIEEGPVEKGIENGDWQIIINGEQYPEHYANGERTTKLPQDTTAKVYTEVDVEPDFRGGMMAFYQFLARTIRYPAVDRENNKTGKVWVTFIVERDGSLTDVHVKETPSKTLGEEAVRSIKLSPRWMPGLAHGRVVRVQYTVPVNFTLARD